MYGLWFTVGTDYDYFVVHVGGNSAVSGRAACMNVGWVDRVKFLVWEMDARLLGGQTQATKVR